MNMYKQVLSIFNSQVSNSLLSSPEMRIMNPTHG